MPSRAQLSVHVDTSPNTHAPTNGKSCCEMAVQVRGQTCEKWHEIPLSSHTHLIWKRLMREAVPVLQGSACCLVAEWVMSAVQVSRGDHDGSKRREGVSDGATDFRQQKRASHALLRVTENRTLGSTYKFHNGRRILTPTAQGFRTLGSTTNLHGRFHSMPIIDKADKDLAYGWNKRECRVVGI